MHATTASPAGFYAGTLTTASPDDVASDARMVVTISPSGVARLEGCVRTYGEGTDVRDVRLREDGVPVGPDGRFTVRAHGVTVHARAGEDRLTGTVCAHTGGARLGRTAFAFTRRPF